MLADMIARHGPRGPLHVTAHVHRAPNGAGDPAPYAGEDSFTFVRVQLRCADGIVGNGFTGRFCAAEVAHLLNGSIAEALAGGMTVADLARTLNPRGMTGVVVSALSALDIALWDLLGQRAGQSVASLLGAGRKAARAHVTCGFSDLDQGTLVAACTNEIAAGAAGVKVLVAGKGRTVADDIARLRAVRGAIGDGPDLIADANCGWDLEHALEFARGVADLRLSWLEEPLRQNDRHGLAALSRSGLVPLGAGQMEQSADRFELLSEAGVDVIQPNAVFAGGIDAAVNAARAALLADRAVSPAGGWDIINLHWMCSAVAEGCVELHRAQTRIARLLCARPLDLKDGFLHIPDAPGFGLEPDDAALVACRV